MTRSELLQFFDIAVSYNTDHYELKLKDTTLITKKVTFLDIFTLIKNHMEEEK